METGMKDTWKQLLKTAKFFQNFSDEELNELVQLCEVKKYASQEYIVKEGSEDSSFFIILRGKANIIKGNPLTGKQKISELTAGRCFGEMAVLLKEPRSASIMAIGEVYAFKIHGEQISQLKIEAREKLYRQFAVNLALQLKDASEQIVER